MDTHRTNDWSHILYHMNRDCRHEEVKQIQSVHKRLWFLLSSLLLLVIVIWQLHAAGADTLSDTTTFKNTEITIRIESDSSNAHVMKEQQFRIEVIDANGFPIDDAQIRMKYWMPKMFCGEFEASISKIGSGQYEAASFPVMSGIWKAEAVVDIGKERYTVDHLIRVKH